VIPIGLNAAPVMVIALGAGVLPIFASFALWGRLGRPSARFLPPFSTGLLFWSLYDLLQEAAGLNIGAGNPSAQILSLSLAGAVLMATSSLSRASPPKRALYLLSYAWAVGLALHSVGEGVVIGYDFRTGQSVLDFNQMTSFLLHKFAEGSTLFIILLWARVKQIDYFSTALIAGAPIAIGTLLGFSGASGSIAVFLFSAAVGSNIYILTFLISRIDLRSFTSGLFILGGLAFMYGAGLLHVLG